MTWKCIIVDDEPPAQRVIEMFLKDLPSIELIAKCNSAFEANDILMKYDIDIMFLDINMPKMSGLNFLKSLNKKPAVIITTAFREYALEGFELDVIDYLKKPFSFERFFKAVNKAIESVKTKSTHTNNKHIPEIKANREYIFVKEDKATYKISMNDIYFIESVGDYNKIYTKDKVYLAYQTLKKLQDLLPSDQFPRIHKSYIIALNKIEKIIGNHIKIMGQDVPIGQTYRKSFFDLIE
ncbi:LytR/AlgR family response regulator transcription factor [Bacteroidota bacterium]